MIIQIISIALFIHYFNEFKFILLAYLYENSGRHIEIEVPYLYNSTQLDSENH